VILRVPVKIVREGAELPQRAYEYDAAFDLCSAVDVTLRPQERATVPTGIALGLPAHVAGLTVPRSGLAARHGITIVNAPGLIDPGYRGEVHVVLLNTDREQAFEIRRGDRIAQLLFLAPAATELVSAEELPASERGDRGFGSSGVSTATSNESDV